MRGTNGKEDVMKVKYIELEVNAEGLKIVLEKNFGHTGGASVLAQLIDAQPTILEAEEQKE